MRRAPHPARRGSVLVVVAALATLIVGLGLAFLMRMRSEAEDNQQLIHDLQARVMLMAGCNYVLECARIGYDPRPEDVDPTSNPRTHAEAFGWIDVRPVFNGAPVRNGPLDGQGLPLWSAAVTTPPGRGPRRAWPAIGAASRCPMEVLRQPPYATANAATYNPIPNLEGPPGFGLAYLRFPDPQPAPNTGNGWPDGATDPVAAAGAVSATGYGTRDTPLTFAGGDRAPRPSSTGMSWFRVYRETASVFVITCGAGATHGFRDWADVTYPPSRAELFGGDQALFERIRAEEVRLWYRVEWSDAVGAVFWGGFIDNEIYPNQRTWDHWLLHPVNSSQRSSGSLRNNIFRPNQCGTIRWIQRLESGPTAPTSDPDDIGW